MVQTRRFKNVSWIDIKHPTAEEVREVMHLYKIHPLAAEELLTPTPEPKVDTYSDCIYLVLHFPIHTWTSTEKTDEIDFIIGKDYIVTARYSTIDSLHGFSKMFEMSETINKDKIEATNAGTIFYWMMRSIYQTLGAKIQSAKNSLMEIEEDIFDGKEREMVTEISKLSRELLAFKHTVALHGKVLTAFRPAALKFFGEGYGYELNLIQNEYDHIQQLASGYLESLSRMRDTNDSLLHTKENAIMQRLTVIIFITSIISIFLSLFAIGAVSRPVIDSPYDFWILTGVILVIGLASYLYFKIKKWL